MGVPYFQQRDCAQRSQRDRTCFSSSCAMLLEALKPGTLPGANGDDQYLAVVQRYGDTTDAGAQLQALAHFGVTARLVQDGYFQLIEEQIARGIPVPCGTIHRGPVERPTGSGHWLIFVGHTPTHLVVNDPRGQPVLLSGATLNANGMGLRFSRQNYRCAGRRLRQALDGGTHRRWGLPPCAWQGVGGGGGGWGWLRVGASRRRDDMLLLSATGPFVSHGVVVRPGKTGLGYFACKAGVKLGLVSDN